ncbi:MAG: acetyl-CoA C-acetyltransferase, partial [Candidatus Azotimanducaceae bacterium]
MGDVYIVEACRSAIGKRGKGLAGLKPADLLGAVQKAAIERSGIDASKIDQVI